MAHNRHYKPEDILFPDQVITESKLVEEMERRFDEMTAVVNRYA